jgi:hypothetical protein
MNREKDKLSDEPCRTDQGAPDRCQAHGQPLLDCANGRLRQVKQAREMDERSMASARAWQKEANDAILRLKKKEGAP